jgi:hypothetical protein
MQTFESPRGNRRLLTLIGIGTVIGLFVLTTVVWLMGSSNPYTPAGYVGYLTKGAVFGKSRFIGTQQGPTSAGRTWLLEVTNVSVTPYTYTEQFEKDTAVLAKDNLKLAFQVHSVFNIHAERVPLFMEKFSVVLADHDKEDKNPNSIVQAAYGNFIREALRTYARDEVQQRNGLEVKDQLIPIGVAIQRRIREYAKDSPFNIESIVVGNIQYPAEVADAVSKKLASTQELQRMDTQIEITRKTRQVREIEAQGIANAMEIIQQKLTSQYLQHEAIEAQKMQVNSPNHTTIYIPVGPMGVPIVGTMDVNGRSSPPRVASNEKKDQ